jgi:hypothetical protein
LGCSGIPPGSASSGEADQYHVYAELLKIAGAHIEYAKVTVSGATTSVKNDG